MTEVRTITQKRMPRLNQNVSGSRSLGKYVRSKMNAANGEERWKRDGKLAEQIEQISAGGHRPPGSILSSPFEISTPHSGREERKNWTGNKMKMKLK